MIPERPYETIFERQSIRKYDRAPLSDTLLDAVKARIGKLTPLDPDIPVSIHIIDARDMGRFLGVAAPHYAVAYTTDQEGALENVGFMMEQLDLFFSAGGLGSCWLGMAKPRRAPDTGTLTFTVAMAFGRPAVPPHRDSVKEFDRKPLSQITALPPEEAGLLEAVRLAPSAMNGQPWYFTGGPALLHVYRAQTGAVRALALKRLNRIDMGIALCNLWLAARHRGQDMERTRDDEAQAQTPKGHEYVTSVRFA